MSGLRHGFGIRQSAPFNVATPLRHAGPLRQQAVARQRKLRHSQSMPAVGSSSPNYDFTTSAADATLPDRGRSGFALTGDGFNDGRRRTPRIRSASAHRSLADSFGSTRPNRLRHKSDAPADDDTSQVLFVLNQIYTGISGFSQSTHPSCAFIESAPSV